MRIVICNYYYYTSVYDSNMGYTSRPLPRDALCIRTDVQGEPDKRFENGGQGKAQSVWEFNEQSISRFTNTRFLKATSHRIVDVTPQYITSI